MKMVSLSVPSHVVMVGQGRGNSTNVRTIKSIPLYLEMRQNLSRFAVKRMCHIANLKRINEERDEEGYQPLSILAMQQQVPCVNKTLLLRQS